MIVCSALHIGVYGRAKRIPYKIESQKKQKKREALLDLHRSMKVKRERERGRVGKRERRHLLQRRVRGAYLLSYREKREGEGGKEMIAY